MCRFEFDTRQPRDMKETAEILDLLGRSGVPMPVAWARAESAIPAVRDDEPLLPDWVRSLFSARLNSDALAAYSCEFDTVWVEEALDNGRWPAPGGDNDPDRLFADYQGRLDTPWPMHERTGLAYHLDDPPAVVAQDIVTTKAKDHD